jgi:streptomycin 6-kinase
MLLHGDAHPLNVLAAPAGGFRLIDPDGVIGEREYDLAIPLRHPDRSELGGDPCADVRGLSVRIAEPVGADAEAVWQWAFVERVSTGLLCARLGHATWAESLLGLVDELAASG